VSDLQNLPVETVESSFESGGTPETHTFTGVRLLDALDLAELDVDEDARNPLLLLYVVVTASDGYQIVLSGGELDPNFGDTLVLLAWEEDGEPLAPDRGPLRLVIPGDLRGGRHVWGVISLDVRSIAIQSS
jgi:DMSO/TMAO reductase YedYZ molybdopterin-dependent catalytic subunit